MVKWSISLFFLLVMACRSQKDLPQILSTHLEQPVVLSIKRDLSFDDGFVLWVDILDKSLSLAQVKSSISIIPSPSSEVLDDVSTTRELGFILKNTPVRDRYELEIKKRLELNHIYGIFLREFFSSKKNLIYSFKVPHRPAQVLDHDLGRAHPLTVGVDRSIFKLSLTDPLEKLSMGAVRISSLDQDVDSPTIDSITLDETHRVITIELMRKSSSPLVQGTKYALGFDQGVFGHELAPIEFLASGSSPPFVEHKSISISSSENSVEFVWTLSNEHDSLISISDMDDAPLCPRESCQPVVPSVSSRVDGNNGHVTRHYVGGLRPNTRYNFMVRSQDRSGDILINGGTFSTSGNEYLRFSGFMIDPQLQKGEPQSVGEYIEVINIGDVDVPLDDIKIQIEDDHLGSFLDCPVSSQGSDVTIGPGQRFLLTSSRFKEEQLGLSNSARIFRLSQKTLCGGLSNNKPKIIKLHRGDGHFIDRFGGKPWINKKERGLWRKDPRGLDEPTNYCYFNTPL